MCLQREILNVEKGGLVVEKKQKALMGWDSSITPKVSKLISKTNRVDNDCVWTKAESCSSNQGWFCPPRNIWQCLETFSVVIDWQEVILASSTYRPGMPLNILQYTGQPPTIGNYLAPNDTGAEIEKAWFRSNEDGWSSAKQSRACSTSECAQKGRGAALLHCQPFVLWQVSGYSLLVQAVDSGIPVMSSTATVNIDISDVNDNSPVFTPANYTAVIQVSKCCYQALVLMP